MCSAVAYLHERNIVHHDLKPGNILIFGDSVKIGDFGISRDLASKNYIETNKVRGTVNYIAPEIWNGEPYNARSDVWALGCILFELCTLQLAFPGEVAQVYGKIMNGKFDPIPAHLPYSDRVRCIVDLLIQKD